MIDNPRLDLLISKHARQLVIIAIAIGILTIVATGWVVANPSTAIVTEQTGEERVETDVHTSALVIMDGLWTDGETLEDSSVYTLNDTPVVTLEPRTTVPNDDTDVNHRVTVEFEATRDGSTFWENTDERLNASVPVENGVATSAVEIDVPELLERRAEINEQLAGVGSLALSVHVETEYDTGTVADRQEMSTRLDANDRAYWFGERMSASDPNTQQTDREVTESTNPAFVGAMALLALLSFAGAGFITYRTPIDADAARRAVHERRYADWISQGSIPMWIGDHHISLDTLEDVVDVAIDTNERVVHDRQRGLFAVMSNDVIYYYSEQGLWEETAWPEINLQSQQQPPIADSDVEQSDDEEKPQPNAGVPGDLPDPDDEDAWQQL